MLPRVDTATAYHSFVENAMRHVAATIDETRKRGATSVEAKLDAQNRFHADMLKSGRNFIYYLRTHCSGSNTYFVNSQGEAPYIRPWSILKNRRKSTRFDRDDYQYRTIAHGESGATGQEAATDKSSDAVGAL